MPAERMAGLQEAHRRGIPVWVSLTPVVDPKQSLSLIRQTSAFVDLYNIGALEIEGMPGEGPKLPRTPRFEWRAFARKAVALCKSLGVPCYVRAKMNEDPRVARHLRAADLAMDARTWAAVCRARRPKWEPLSDDDHAAALAETALARYRA